MENTIYFDNNGTTMMSPTAIQAMTMWCNKGNPSASYKSAEAARTMMTTFREYVGKICALNPCCVEPRDQKTKPSQIQPNQYEIFFTSGASESNCTIITSTAMAYLRHRDAVPHFVLSSFEHKSVVECINTLVDDGYATATFVKPVQGRIRAADIEAAFEPNTCMVCVMHANNETGVINPIDEIGKRAHASNILFFTDAVQTFGKFPLQPTPHVDAFSVSFHKFGGPPGVGLLVIKKAFFDGYDLKPIIFGSQNFGFRGGTENLPGIGSSFAALKIAMTDRVKKNAQMQSIKKYIVDQIKSHAPSRDFDEYVAVMAKKSALAAAGKTDPSLRLPEIEVVFISGTDTAKYLPNTIMLSVVKRTQPPMCNVKFKADLEAKNIIVSVGSACNTASEKASHVLYEIGADELIRKGALRISLGDASTLKEAERFVSIFLSMLATFTTKKPPAKK